ncbi:MAG: exodeoxyribonuclease I [Methylococcales bacterium]|nr:exodeoxyribonuclease I [Methylococcales bacterium]
MTEVTFYWHDYETFGVDPMRDRPAQFAGVRTDADFNPIEPPLELYCRLPEDYLPDPEACLLTGITPDKVNQDGVCEAEFARRIEQVFSVPGTCALGYNSLRFDDEVTRHLFYRNFFDPYRREWDNGNSRWDLIDLARATYALRPDGIEWPFDDDGLPSFRLERLTEANSLMHDAAHDALSDVYATIELAKLIRRAQPRLYDFFWQHKSKAKARALLALGSGQPLVHVSGQYARERHCLAVVLPLCPHPDNTNAIIVYDLSVDPQPLLALDREQIRARLFSKTCDLPENVARIPLKAVHVNKCPILAPLKVLRAEDQARLAIDLALCRRYAEELSAASELAAKVQAVFTADDRLASPDDDPETQLYSGGFISDQDRQLMIKVHQSNPEQLARIDWPFHDARLPELLFRYRGRNFPQTLSPDEQARWRAHVKQRRSVCLPRFMQQLTACGEQALPPAAAVVYDQLQQYAARLAVSPKNHERYHG